MRLQIKVDRYEIFQHDDGEMFATRDGSFWRDLSGDKLVLALAQALEEAQKEAQK